MGDAGVPGVVDNWCTHRDMDSVQESSRCKQTKPSLWPTRPAGRIRDHSPVARAGLSPGLAWYAPRAIASRTPVQALAKDQTTGEGRSPGRDHPNRRQCPERGTHTDRTDTRGKDTPGTPTDRSRQHARHRQLAMANGSTAARSTQHAVSEGGDTAHAHARNDTPPRPPRPVEELHRPRHSANPPDRHTPTPATRGGRSGPAPDALAAPTAPQPPPLLPLPLPPRPRGHTSPVSPGPGRTPRPPPHRPPSLPA